MEEKMKRPFWIRYVLLPSWIKYALIIALSFAILFYFSDEDTEVVDVVESPALSPSECDAVITQIYDICQSDVNSWVRDELLGYCYGGGGADWEWLQACVNQFPNDCAAIFACQ